MRHSWLGYADVENKRRSQGVTVGRTYGWDEQPLSTRKKRAAYAVRFRQEECAERRLSDVEWLTSQSEVKSRCSQALTVVYISHETSQCTRLCHPYPATLLGCRARARFPTAANKSFWLIPCSHPPLTPVTTTRIISP